MELSERETAHILAALRYAQRPGNDLSGMEHFAEVKPLSEAEVDALAEKLNLGEEKLMKYTVIGLYPDTQWDGCLRDATFVQHVKASTPLQAASSARSWAAQSLAASESTINHEDIEILAVFPGQLMDVWEPGVDGL